MEFKWRWEQPLPGTTLFPHHRRWDCRIAMVGAMRYMKDDKAEAREYLARARAFNAIMFDCHDPMASRYAIRLDKIAAAI